MIKSLFYERFSNKATNKSAYCTSTYSNDELFFTSMNIYILRKMNATRSVNEFLRPYCAMPARAL